MPIPTGFLKASYDFSNTSSYPGTGGTLYDLSGTGNTLNNPTLTGTFSGTGQSKYYSFAGGNDQFGLLGSNGFGATTLRYEGAIFAWVRSSDWNDPAQSSGYNYMMGYGEDVFPGGGHLGLFKQISSTYYPSGPGALMGSGVAATFYPGGLSNNQWLHLGYVATGTTCNLYLNGVKVQSSPQDYNYVYGFGTTGYIGNSIPGTTPFIALGALGPGGYAPASNFDLAIADIFLTSLDDTDVTDLYNSQAYRFVGGSPPGPALPNPIAKYDFSDPSSYPGSGTSLSDLSASGFTLINSTLSGTFAGSGQSKYYSFAGGTDQFYRDNTTSAFGSSNRLYTASMFMWVRSSDWNTPTGGYRCLAGWGEDIGTGGGQLAVWKQVAFDTNDQYGMMGSGWGATYYPGGLSTNQWVHVGYVVDGTNANLYVDGALVNSVPQDFVYAAGPTGTYGWISAATAPYLAPLTLGGLYTNYYASDGFDLALAEFYNVGFASTQVTQLYNSQSSRFSGGPPPPTPYLGSVGGRTFGMGFAG